MVADIDGRVGHRHHGGQGQQRGGRQDDGQQGGQQDESGRGGRGDERRAFGRRRVVLVIGVGGRRGRGRRFGSVPGGVRGRERGRGGVTAGQTATGRVARRRRHQDADFIVRVSVAEVKVTVNTIKII